MKLLTIYEVPMIAVEGIEKQWSEFKVVKCRVPMMYKYSNDEKVKNTGVTTRSGRKRAAGTSGAHAVSALNLKDIIGNPCIGKQGLGSTQFQLCGKADPRRKREMIPAKVWHLKEENEEGKGSGTWISRSLDKVGPAEVENRLA